MDKKDNNNSSALSRLAVIRRVKNRNIILQLTNKNNYTRIKCKTSRSTLKKLINLI